MQTSQIGEFKTFVGGLVTEASPLNFPENASLDEQNFVLNKDGTRRRRLGMDLETKVTPANLSMAVPPITELAVATYEWENPAGASDKKFTVIQIQNQVYVIDRSDSALANVGYIKGSFPLSTTRAHVEQASFASVDGFLVVSNGLEDILTIEYNDVTNTLSDFTHRVKIRDFFGRESVASVGGNTVDLTQDEFVNFRPALGELTDGIAYNLRNQGWAVPRVKWGTPDPLKEDPLRLFASGWNNDKTNPIPSLADSPTPNLYANTALAAEASNSKATVVRFDDGSSEREEPVKTRAPVGHFVIDLLNRGDSRAEQYNNLTDIYANANPSETTKGISFLNPTLPVSGSDKTTKGAAVVGAFAGRIWYAGFGDDVEGAIPTSPKLSSYVFYSQNIKDKEQLGRCYQDGDPTDIETPELLDTDGGFIKLSGCSNIKAMIPLSTALIVLAENGIWSIEGGDANLFTANSQRVAKISEVGVKSAGSVVLAEGALLFWSEDAIYLISGNEAGYTAQSVSEAISKFYHEIPEKQKQLVQGGYDRYDKKVRWTYNNFYSAEGDVIELVFDLNLKAFYKSVIKRLRNGRDPLVIAPVRVPLFQVGVVQEDVTYFGSPVLYNGTPVVATLSDPKESLGFRNTAYLTLLDPQDPTLAKLSFSTYSDENFVDWASESADGKGVDARAYLLTGYMGSGDSFRNKQAPYVFFHFIKTEDGFEEVGDDYLPKNQSSCLVQAQWDWTNSPEYGKWGKQFQAYREKRAYFPEDGADGYVTGQRVISSRNKLRGRGKVLSFLISSEEGKDLNLLGWSLILGTNGNA